MSNNLVLFFDNDPLNFKDEYLCTNIKTILIPDTPITNLKSLVFTSLQNYQNYINHLSHQAHIFAKTLNQIYKSNIDAWDPISGLQKTHVQKIIQYPFPIKAVILDWDRTLSVFEGIFVNGPTVEYVIQELKLQNIIKPQHIAEYYLGGSQRIYTLQVLWNWLYKNNIQIYILSSNPSIGRFPTFFSQLLNSVHLTIRTDHILYRGNLTKFQFIKQQLPFLSENIFLSNSPSNPLYHTQNYNPIQRFTPISNPSHFYNIQKPYYQPPYHNPRFYKKNKFIY